MLNWNVLVLCCQWNKHSLNSVLSTLSHCSLYPAFITLIKSIFIVNLSVLTVGQKCKVCNFFVFYLSPKALSLLILFDDLCRKGTLFKLWSWKSEHLFSSLIKSKLSSWPNHWLFRNWFTTYKVWEGGKKLAFLGLSPKPEKKTPKI